jgi:cell division protein FtsI/penicillin-binding protein 2
MLARRSMFAKRRSKGPWVAGIALAGAAAALALGRGGPALPPASIAGAPLVDPARAGSAGAGSAAAAPAPLDRAALAALLDLDRIARDGDRYVATLTDGRRAQLTLDPRLQPLAEQLLDQSRAPRGAIVVMAPDGRVLALAGRRTERPTGAIRGTFDWRLATDVWAPGASIFKLVTASALVRAGVDPAGRVCFHGGLRSVVERNLRDDRRDRRCESLAYGVAHSQNAILAKLAFQRLEPAALAAEAKLLGWGEPALGDLRPVTGELALPSERDLAYGRAAAGFTGARLSVLGGALLAATFAAGGEQPAVRLVAAVDGAPVPPDRPRRAIDADTARAVAAMMVGTCASGSAARAFGRRAKVQAAGKTGTLTTSQPHHIEHSWFVGFAPAERPEVVVSVLLGNAESWHLRGYEAARKLIDAATQPAPPAAEPAPATAREKGRTARRSRAPAARRALAH